MTPNGSNDTVTLEIIRASEVTPREVKWLWYPYIPFGKITLLQGDPGDGKSKFMLALSALLTDGKPLPFQEAEEASGPMTVIYQTTEDDADDTVVPRFIASGVHDEIELTADEAFSLFAPKLGRPSEKVDGAVAFLKELLSDGRPQLATECETKLEAAGFKKSTIKKAKKKAGVHSVKEGFLWYWALTVGEKPKEERQAVTADDGLPF